MQARHRRRLARRDALLGHDGVGRLDHAGVEARAGRVLELDEGPLFVSYPVEIGVEDLREGMVLSLRWTDGQDKFGEYNLPVFGPLSK